MRSHIPKQLLRSAFQRQQGCQWGVQKPSNFLQNGSPSHRHLWLLRIFNKEARAQDKARLQDELNRGYFDDMRDLAKHGGKLHATSNNLLPIAAALKFPPLEVYFRTGNSITLPVEESSADLTVVCIGFRANAQAMIESWSLPFLDAFKATPNVELYEVSVVESLLLSTPPLKQLLLRSMKAPKLPDNDQLVRRNVVFAFGDKYWFRKAVTIPNLLTGYIFLLDKKGRIRWRATGSATSEELSFMMSCASRLLKEEQSSF